MKIRGLRGERAEGIRLLWTDSTVEGKGEVRVSRGYQGLSGEEVPRGSEMGM